MPYKALNAERSREDDDHGGEGPLLIECHGDERVELGPQCQEQDVLALPHGGSDRDVSQNTKSSSRWLDGRDERCACKGFEARPGEF